MTPTRKVLSRGEKTIALAIYAAFSVPTTGFAAAGDPIGPPILGAVNQFSTVRPTIASAADGRFVVASLVTQPACQPCTQSISVQRFDADGAPVGNPIALTTDADHIAQPQAVGVAMAADGDFVVTYNEYPSARIGTRIHAASFSADGTPRSGNIEIANVVATGRRGRVSTNVAIDSQGDFTVAWHNHSSAGEVDLYGPAFYLTTDTITARRFHADGTALTRAVVVDSQSGSYNSRTQYRGNRQAILEPAIASDGAGNFTVGWIGATGDGPFSVNLRSYSAQAVALGRAVQANTDTAGNIYQISLAMNPSGRSTVAWTSATTAFTARNFQVNGTPDGLPFAVAGDLTLAQSVIEYDDISVSIDAVGDVAVVSEIPAVQSGVYVRRFTPAGAPRGPSILVNPVDAFSFYTTSVDGASDASGNFDVLYSGNSQPVPGAILVQRYQGP